jgi:branched-chain amino acid transport system permease protein
VRSPSDFVVSLALACLMYAALASSWSTFCGSTRYLSLATAAFFGIGAYTSALTLGKLPWLAAIGLGAAIAARSRSSWARRCCTCAAPISRC